MVSFKSLAALAATATLITADPIRRPGGSLTRPAPQTYEKKGDFTYFHPRTYSACATWDEDTDMVAAISAVHFDADKPCGRYIKISSIAGSAVVNVTDRCEACKIDDIDLSPAAFIKVVGDLEIGREQGSWQWE